MLSEKLKNKITSIELPEGATGLALFYDGRDGRDEWFICPQVEWGINGQTELLKLTTREGETLSRSKLVGPDTYQGFHNRKVFMVYI